MLGIGIIGAGRVAQIAHLATFSQVAGARVVAVADLRLSLAALVAERWGVPAAYARHSELLADPAVDAVVIVTQRDQTAAIARDALAAGKHVLSEKPMALSSVDAQANVALAHGRGCRYAVGYMKRHDRGIQAARALIERWQRTCEAGAMQLVRIAMHGGDDRAGDNWLMTPDPRLDAGFRVTDPVADTSPRSPLDRFLNVFSHTTNLARFLVGATLEIEAVVPTALGGELDGSVGSCPFTASFAAQSGGAWDERVDVVFERANIAVVLPAPFDRSASASIRVAYPDGTAGDLSSPGWAFALQAQRFVDDVATSSEPVASGRDAVADVVLGEHFARFSDASPA